MLFPINFAENIIEYTAANSNYDTSRNYISMSHSNQSPIEMVEAYRNGYHDDLLTRLKCYKGYQMERDLVQRIVNVYGDRITLNYEITAYNGIVKGHPDFLFDGLPCDCKSVLKDEWIPTDKVPARVFFQMQSYMLYMDKHMSMVVYESRENGIIRTFIVPANRKVQLQIETNHSICLEMLREPSRITRAQ